MEVSKKLKVKNVYYVSIRIILCYHSADDLIGSNTIPLRGIIEEFEKNRPYHFKKNLRCNGELTGTISGSIRIEQMHHKVVQRFKDEDVQKNLLPLSIGMKYQQSCICSIS